MFYFEKRDDCAKLFAIIVTCYDTNNKNIHKQHQAYVEENTKRYGRRSGINEPYINPDPTTMFVHSGGKGYKFDADGIPYRFDPPDTEKPRKKTEPNKKTEA